LRLRACDNQQAVDLATIRAAVSQAMQRRTIESEIHSSAEKVQELLSELQNQKVEEQLAKTRGDIYASINPRTSRPADGHIRLRAGAQPAPQSLVPAGNGGLWNSSRTACALSRGRWGNCVEFPGAIWVFSAVIGGSPRASVNQLLKDLEQLIRVHPGRSDNEFGVQPLADDLGVK